MLFVKWSTRCSSERRAANPRKIPADRPHTSSDVFTQAAKKQGCGRDVGGTLASPGENARLSRFFATYPVSGRFAGNRAENCGGGPSATAGRARHGGASPKSWPLTAHYRSVGAGGPIGGSPETGGGYSCLLIWRSWR